MPTIQDLILLAQEAGKAVFKIYHQKGESLICLKDDGSPFTQADRAAHNLIMAGLERLYPQIPVVSEEGESHAPYAPGAKEFFLVDPIDGTTDFLKRTGEFTVNIAYIKEGTVRMGVVLAPVLDECFWGVEGGGAFKNGEPIFRKSLDLASPPCPLRALVSVSHRDAKTDACLSPFAQVAALSVGSSLKFCRLAENFADYYPRAVSLHEWDIAAGHAVLKAAVGNVYRMGTRDEVRYGAKDFTTPLFEAY
jgi:3'(2'),5'-bisphosphate nucleotidase